MPLKGVVMNRVHLPLPGMDGGKVSPSVDRVLDAVAGKNVRVREWLSTTVRNLAVQAAAEEVRREDFEAGLPAGVEVTVIPEQRGDVHDLAELALVGSYLRED
jgi:hypothetical protein